MRYQKIGQLDLLPSKRGRKVVLKNTKNNNKKIKLLFKKLDKEQDKSYSSYKNNEGVWKRSLLIKFRSWFFKIIKKTEKNGRSKNERRSCAAISFQKITQIKRPSVNC
ncbi:hypothetical protein [Mycoplasma bradburyae]|uniref:hypothetical protein n=1 Tax=Mycoplasma bradburyae TaxID=2963128 RepID=UPI00233FD16A|nr:hypothetical protein [Mycoplasma bradburyae]MDC4182944.1 hypothetical protein [Mycoplasma bradburyae]